MSSIKQYRKKPVVIEAIAFSGTNHDEIADFVGTGTLGGVRVGGGYTLIIPTLEGDMQAKVGDYVIKGVKGEFYPCKPDIFEATYEMVEKP